MRGWFAICAASNEARLWIRGEAAGSDAVAGVAARGVGRVDS